MAPTGTTFVNTSRAVIELGRYGQLRLADVSECREFALIDGWWRGDRAAGKPTRPDSWRLLAVDGEVADASAWPDAGTERAPPSLSDLSDALAILA